jgi:hypothetical protein
MNLKIFSYFFFLQTLGLRVLSSISLGVELSVKQLQLQSSSYKHGQYPKTLSQATAVDKNFVEV